MNRAGTPDRSLGRSGTCTLSASNVDPKPGALTVGLGRRTNSELDHSRCMFVRASSWIVSNVPVFETEQKKFGVSLSRGSDGGCTAWLLRRDAAEFGNVLLAGPDVGAQISRRNLPVCRAIN